MIRIQNHAASIYLVSIYHRFAPCPNAVATDVSIEPISEVAVYTEDGPDIGGSRYTIDQAQS
jgi:hypothetical protein